MFQSTNVHQKVDEQPSITYSLNNTIQRILYLRRLKLQLQQLLTYVGHNYKP
jgi:hypothetical protein